MDRGCRSRSKVGKEAQFGKPQDPDDGGCDYNGDDYHADDDSDDDGYHVDDEDDDDDDLQDHVHLPEARKAFIPD